jgi:hypothetical protein
MKKFKMKKSVKKLWTDGLRSGKYEQYRSEYAGPDNCRCALGVLIDEYSSKVSRRKINWNSDKSYDKGNKILADVFGGREMSDQIGSKIIAFNDKKGWSFNKIASYVDRYL